jgi:hypothetical protein
LVPSAARAESFSPSASPERSERSDAGESIHATGRGAASGRQAFELTESNAVIGLAGERAFEGVPRTLFVTQLK